MMQNKTEANLCATDLQITPARASCRQASRVAFFSRWAGGGGWGRAVRILPCKSLAEWKGQRGVLLS